MCASSTNAIPPHPKTPKQPTPCVPEWPKLFSPDSRMTFHMFEADRVHATHDHAKKKEKGQPECDKRCIYIYIRTFSRHSGQKLVSCYSHLHINWVGNLKQLPSNFTTPMNHKISLSMAKKHLIQIKANHFKDNVFVLTCHQKLDRIIYSTLSHLHCEEVKSNHHWSHPETNLRPIGSRWLVYIYLRENP